MATDNDYPQELAEASAAIDPNDVVASQYNQDEAEASSIDGAGPQSPSKRKSGTRGAAVGVGVVAVVLIAGAAFALFHHSRPASDNANPELVAIRQRANAMPAQKASTIKRKVAQAAVTAKLVPPAPAATQHVVAAAPPPPPPPPAATAAMPPSAPPIPAPTTLPSETVVAKTAATSLPLTPPAPLPATSASAANPITAAAPTAPSATDEQVATLTHQIDALKARLVRQSRDLADARSRAHHSIPSNTVVTAALKDGVVLTLPTGRKVIVHTGDAIK